MTYGSSESGSVVFTMTPEEHAQFKAGKVVSKIVSSAAGNAKITVKLIYPRDRNNRPPRRKVLR